MSNLILVPSSGAEVEGPLTDRVLMLNTEKAPRFQCFGFVVTRNAPIQIVPESAQHEQLRRALAAGVLLDITGQQNAKGMNKIVADIDAAIQSQRISAVAEGEEIGPRAFVGTDAKGQSYCIVPKDEEEYQRMAEEVRTTGTLRIEKPKDPRRGATITGLTGLSGIYTEDIETIGGPTGE